MTQSCFVWKSSSNQSLFGIIFASFTATLLRCHPSRPQPEDHFHARQSALPCFLGLSPLDVSHPARLHYRRPTPTPPRGPRTPSESSVNVCQVSAPIFRLKKRRLTFLDLCVLNLSVNLTQLFKLLPK